MKNLNTGTGLALLSAAILGSTIIMRYGPADQVAHAAPPMEAAKAIAAASAAQVTPTIVWYSAIGTAPKMALYRAWSDGRVEMRTVERQETAYSNGSYISVWCNPAYQPCMTPWVVVSDSNSGFNAAADINFDSKVDGDDLGQLLAAWGPAPRHDIPPSDCPLNLINP